MQEWSWSEAAARQIDRVKAEAERLLSPEILPVLDGFDPVVPRLQDGAEDRGMDPGGAGQRFEELTRAVTGLLRTLPYMGPITEEADRTGSPLGPWEVPSMSGV